ncbi:MAG: response regulator [Bacteroidetes bacterium]|nr:MAG: response regulator [Bacteroidota bacterium]
MLSLILGWGIFNRLKVTREQKLIIEEQKKKVEQSEKYKEQFLANMSHEIRTPMHAISGMVNILKRNDHPSSQDIYLDAMSKSSDNLVVILNDVLDLSKIEAGKLDIESTPMDPRSVIDNVLQILKFKAEEKGLTMSAKVDDNVPQLVMGDPARLNQILINLVGNAIKFTEKGSVSINLKTADDTLVFKVEDTGIGIPEEKQEHIFGAFEQATESTNKYYGGTGLGLNITRQLVELQKGSVSVNSEQGKGSTFSVSLPLVKAKAEAKGSEVLTEERLNSMLGSLKGIRILLAEDNPFNQMIARDDLEYYIEEVTIDVAENGQEAIEKYKSETYDIILMDVQMPEVNGFEATRGIRSIEAENKIKKPIPIIAMTASLLATEINNCYEAGMNNYIPKPYKVNELIGTIFQEHQKDV